MSSSSASEATPGELPRVVLVVGRQLALREAEVQRLRDAALGGGLRDFNEDRFDLASPGCDPVQILAAARTHPVMAPARFVLVRGAGEKRAARFVEELLPAYLEDPAPGTVLVLEAEAVDRRQRWVKQLGRVGKLIELAGPKGPPEVRAWIERALRERGKRPGPGAAAALADAVGGDVDVLRTEVDKLCLYAGERTEISAEDVSAISGELRPLAIWDLTDQLGQRQLAPALHTLGRLLEQGEAPLALLGALANHFRRLVRARECRPLEASVVQERLGIHPFAARKLTEQARRFDLRRLRQCLDGVRLTDEALKGGAALTPRQALERLLLAVCA
jgi:DNA polymerase-3 subunit delta